MVIPPYKKEDRNLLTHFLRQIHYQNKPELSGYSDALSIVNSIFQASGHQHLLYLVKLRKLWFTEIDSFLSKNAFPRNISSLYKFVVNDNLSFILEKASSSNDLIKTLQKLNGKSYKSKAHIEDTLQQEIKRLSLPNETEIIEQMLKFKLEKKVLHLTVYDGTISQAIRFESQAYLHIFNRLLPELKLDDINCHIGDLGQTQFDQIQVAAMAKDWHKITPESINQKCMPAFFHRASRSRAVLVIYVSSNEALDSLKANPGEEWLIQHLHKQRPEIKDLVHNIAFVPKIGLDLESIRLNSFMLGETSTKISPLNIDDEQLSLNKDNSEKILFAKGQFAKINNRLKSKL